MVGTDFEKINVLRLPVLACSIPQKVERETLGHQEPRGRHLEVLQRKLCSALPSCPWLKFGRSAKPLEANWS